MMTGKITHDLNIEDLKIDLSGAMGDEIVILIKDDFEDQLTAGLSPPLKASSLKKKRRSSNAWDTINRRLWNSLVGYSADSYIEKTPTRVSVGSLVEYYIYQVRMKRDVGISMSTVDKILELFGNKIMKGLGGSK